MLDSLIDISEELMLLQIFSILQNEPNSDSYLVGGCVRDAIGGMKPKDFDIVTNIPIGDINRIFSDNGWKVDHTGEVFLVTNISKNGKQYEIANFRKDGAYKDGRHPTSVEIGNIFTDAKRRDFTINALYYQPHTAKLLDPLKELNCHSGVSDLNNKILRFIGRPEDRIKEDYLRIFRFYRFLSKGFVPDKKSLKACREFFNEAYLQITPERVRMEIEKMIENTTQSEKI